MDSSANGQENKEELFARLYEEYTACATSIRSMTEEIQNLGKKWGVLFMGV